MSPAKFQKSPEPRRPVFESRPKKLVLMGGMQFAKGRAKPKGSLFVQLPCPDSIGFDQMPVSSSQCLIQVSQRTDVLSARSCLVRREKPFENGCNRLCRLQVQSESDVV